MASADEILATQAKLAKKAQELEKYKDDPKMLMEKAAEISKAAKELEKSALKFQAEMEPGGGLEQRVVLTADQRARLAEETGVALEMLVIRDPDGAFAKAMPTTQKATIEKLAAREASLLAVKKERRDAIEKLVKYLKSLGVDGLAPVIEAIEADPTLGKLKEQQAEYARELMEKHGDGGGGG